MTSLHIRAEAAALGAILHEPRLLEQLADQLGPAAWERPWHAQVWGAMTRLRARKEKPTPQAVAAEVAADPDIHDASAVALQVAELMESAPRPEHAASYARMVGDASRRRTLMDIGRRLAQAVTWDEAAETVAQAAAAREALGPVREAHYGPPPRKVTPSTTAEQRQAQLDDLLSHANDVRARAVAAVEPERSSLFAELADIVRKVTSYVMEIQWRPVAAPPDQQRHVGARELAARSAQKRHARREAEEQDATGEATQPDQTPRRTFEAGSVEPDVPAVAEVEQARETAERQMLAAIGADPAAALAAAENLGRGQWADTWRRDIATLAAGLHAAGEAVDPLTLEWAARQAGIVADQPTGDQIPAAELADALRGPVLDPAVTAKAIDAAATRITVAQAAEQVLAAADDPTVEVTATMDQLDATLARVAPDPPETAAVSEAQTSDDVVNPPTSEVPKSESPETERSPNEAQPAPVVTATPAAPDDTSAQAGQASPAPQGTATPTADGGPGVRRTAASSEPYPSLHATPDDENAHRATLSAETRGVADQVFARLDRADGKAITITPTEHAAVLEVRGYSPAVAREAAERIEIDAQRAGEAVTYRPTRPMELPTRRAQRDAADGPAVAEPQHQAEPEARADREKVQKPARQITPGMPAEDMAGTVMTRILHRAGDRADGRVVDRDQVERVLIGHYKVGPETARQAADHAAQLDAERVARRQQSRTTEVPEQRTSDVPKPRRAARREQADQEEQADQQVQAKQQERRADGATSQQHAAPQAAQPTPPAPPQPAQSGMGR